uniref:Uncharacterized protein n=1 Tax=Anguilla anguilla TaxID=7936 RepID=A0A0E9T0B8_ANGAN
MEQMWQRPRSTSESIFQSTISCVAFTLNNNTVMFLSNAILGHSRCIALY